MHSGREERSAVRATSVPLCRAGLCAGLLAIAWAASGGFAAAEPLMACHLRIHVINAARLTRDQLRIVSGDVERIWAPYGVTFEWREGPPAPAAEHPGVVVVALTPVRAGAPGLGHGGAAAPPPLGSVAFASPVTPINVLRVFVSPQRLIASARVERTPLAQWPRVLQERFVAQAIGRTTAHELGHYLLATRQHTGRGLMRESFSAKELLAPDLDGFALDAPDLAIMRTRWVAVTACRVEHLAEAR